MNNTRIDLMKMINLSTVHEFEPTHKDEINDFHNFYSKLQDKTQINIKLEITKENKDGEAIEYTITINPDNKEVSLIEMMTLEYSLFSNISGDLIEILQEHIKSEKQVKQILEDIENEANKLLKLYVN